MTAAAPSDSLRWVDPWGLANLLMGGHAQTAAFILCRLEPVPAAAGLALVDEASAD